MKKITVSLLALSILATGSVFASFYGVLPDPNGSREHKREIEDFNKSLREQQNLEIQREQLRTQQEMLRLEQERNRGGYYY